MSADERGRDEAAGTGAGGRWRGLVRRAGARAPRSLVSLPVAGALLLGVALGGGAGAWWMSERGGSARDAAEEGYCWGALSEKNVRWFLGESEDRTSKELRADGVEVRGEQSMLHTPLEEEPLRRTPGGYCRVTQGKAFDSRLEVTVKVLDSREAYDTWRRDHLHADLEPLAGGLPGMAGPANAWLVLPSACFSPRKEETLTVSVVGSRAARHASPEFAHAAVSVANQVLERHGCQDRFPVLGEPLVVPGQPLDHPEGSPARTWPREKGGRCGLEEDAALLDRFEEEIVEGQAGGPVQVCELRSLGTQGVKLMAFPNPSVLSSVMPTPRPRDMRAVAVPCMQSELVVTGTQGPLEPGAEKLPMVELLRAFAAQQAEQHDCDPKKVKEVSVHDLPAERR